MDVFFVYLKGNPKHLSAAFSGFQSFSFSLFKAHIFRDPDLS